MSLVVCVRLCLFHRLVGPIGRSRLPGLFPDIRYEYTDDIVPQMPISPVVATMFEWVPEVGPYFRAMAKWDYAAVGTRQFIDWSGNIVGLFATVPALLEPLRAAVTWVLGSRFSHRLGGLHLDRLPDLSWLWPGGGQTQTVHADTVLAALNDFYSRRGLGPADVRRLDVAQEAPRALEKREAIRWLRAVEGCGHVRDRALALVPFYGGLRIGETVGLDLDDVRQSARRGLLVVRAGKGDRYREVPLHADLQAAINAWLTERRGWPGAEGPALFLNRRGGRLSARGARDVFAGLAETAGFDDEFSCHVLRHTFATTLTRAGSDVVLVADLLGHARLDTTRRYSLASAADRAAALAHLTVDR